MTEDSSTNVGFRRLDPQSPRTKGDYLKISRSLNLPGRCPILSRCERHEFTVNMIDRQCGGKSEIFQADEPKFPMMESTAYIGGANNFYLRNCCPEVGLFEADFMFAGLGGYPLVSAEYDKYLRPNNQIIETGHFSQCVEFANYQYYEGSVSQVSKKTNRSNDIILVLVHIAQRFPMVVARLSERRKGRPALAFVDEYDVQYLFQALLALEADDIRLEEGTPSVAGGSGRADCLLKKHQTVIEFKMARQGYSAVRLRKEIADDFIVYSKHPDCKILFVFVYDPLRTIENPVGFEEDMSVARPPIEIVRMFIQQS